MANSVIPDPPPQLKAIQPYIKVASDIERLNPVLAYWVRLYCTETALKIDKDSPESKSFLGTLIVWLENFKNANRTNETVSDQAKGAAVARDFIVSLFVKADTLDRNGTANKTTVRMFYMAALLLEAMVVFGPLDGDLSEKAKYAKFKAAYIQKCLKLGQVPKPGPIESNDLDMANEAGSAHDQHGRLNPSDSVSDANSRDSESKSDPGLSNNPEGGAKPSEPFMITPSRNMPSMPTPVSLATPAAVPSTPMQPSLATTTIGGGSSVEKTRFKAINGSPLNPEDLIKCQKFCKFANSALQYDDINTAVANLEKALLLLKTGQKVD